MKRNGERLEEQKIVSEYIRHQIHHPENVENAPYTDELLQSSIERLFRNSWCKGYLTRVFKSDNKLM